MPVFLGGIFDLCKSLLSFFTQSTFCCSKKALVAGAACRWDAERESPLSAGGVASCTDLSLLDTGSILVFDMLIDLARLSLATGDGCLVPEAST